ncbi:MAG: sigma-70 family RNA polymerase sigma factor [Myxococcales bacterium]|nr:sigma-70 family RNA polymerase sigma factor [Myxococcales bacterium]
MTDEVELLAAWRNGHKAAGEVLMARYYPSVLRFFELSATWVAEDLTQKTFLALLERSDALDPERSIRGYLFGIARNQLAMHLRGLAHEPGGLGDEGEPAAEQTRLSTIIARVEEHRVLLRALAELPADLQMVLVLHYWEAMPSAEIGEAVGIPASTVRGRLSRARELLQGEIRARSSRSPLGSADDGELAAWFRSLLAPS